MQAELEPDELERLIRQSWESELIDITEGTTEERVSDGVTFLPPVKSWAEPLGATCQEDNLLGAARDAGRM